MITTAKSKKSASTGNSNRKTKSNTEKSALTKEKNTMGLIRTEIELINSVDLALFRRGSIEEGAVKRMTTPALVDSGADTLVINENIVNQLGLMEVGEETAILADGSTLRLKMVGPVEVKFRNRRTTVDALVMPGDAEVLLGAIPLEGLDVVIDPKRQELTLPPDRPYIAQRILKGGLKRVPRPLE